MNLLRMHVRCYTEFDTISCCQVGPSDHESPSTGPTPNMVFIVRLSGQEVALHVLTCSHVHEIECCVAQLMCYCVAQASSLSVLTSMEVARACRSCSLLTSFLSGIASGKCNVMEATNVEQMLWHKQRDTALVWLLALVGL